MKRLTEFISGVAAMLFQLAFTAWMFCLSEINFNFDALGLNYVLLGAILIAAWLADRFLLGRGVAVPVLAGVQLIFVAAGVWAFVSSAVIEPFVLRTVILNCIFYSIGFVIAIFVAWEPVTHIGILLRLDALVIMTVIIMALDAILGLMGAAATQTVCLAALAFCVLSAVSLRSGALEGRGSAVEGSPALGRIMLFTVVGVIAAMAAAVIAFAAGGVRSFSEFLLSLIRSAWQLIKAFLLWLYQLIERFILWLTSLFDPGPAGPIEMESMEGMGDMEMDMGTASLPGWVYWVLIALAVCAAAYILFRLRKVRTVRVKLQRSYVVSAKRENGFTAELRRLWKKLREALRFRVNCLCYARSAPGLLVLCERRAPEPCRRQCHESGEAFLRRLADEGCESGGEALAELAGAVERCFYSPAAEKVSRELARAVRRVKYKKFEKPDKAAA